MTWFKRAANSKDLVAGRMAVGVVDLLEIVQVHGQYSQRMPLALRASTSAAKRCSAKRRFTDPSMGRPWPDAKKVGVALFFGQLAPQPLDENFLTDHIDVKEHHQSDQTQTTSII